MSQTSILKLSILVALDGEEAIPAALLLRDLATSGRLTLPVKALLRAELPPGRDVRITSCEVTLVNNLPDEEAQP